MNVAALDRLFGGAEAHKQVAQLAQMSALVKRGGGIRNLRKCLEIAGERGAITASGYYGLTLEKQLIDTLGVSLESETMIKGLLVDDGYTPDFTTHDFRNDVTNEVVGTGYTAGGVVITATEITLSGGVLTYDAADSSWPASTIPSAMAEVGYVGRGGASSADELLWLSDFVTAASTTNGTFTIQRNAAGIFTIDYTP